MRALAIAGVGALGITAAVGALAPTAPDLDRGAALYAAQCAACHGANLEGDPNWRAPTPEGRLRAPPHDATGHTWHHGDAVLFRIVKEGSAAVVGGGYESDMPGFGDVLGDAEIRDVLAFIRSTWPEREAAYQAEMTRREGRDG
jgi:mono/diheme cytochrome c family protein